MIFYTTLIKFKNINKWWGSVCYPLLNGYLPIHHYQQLTLNRDGIYG